MNFDLQIIDQLLPLYEPHRYKVLYGGRASGKSLAVADFLITQTAYDRKMVLCCREFQSSIKDSVHKLLRERIYDLGLDSYFTITRDSIRSHAGSEFIFKGLRQHYQEIKSTQGINYCWVEEAERVSAESWEVLKPTVREELSEILITFNPENEQNPTYQQFIINQPPDALVIKINYYDNPFLPKVLLQEIEYDKKHNPDRFHHIWEGECAKMSNAVIFNGKFEIKPCNIFTLGGLDFTPDNHKLRIDYKYGMDFGFSSDPFACIETFKHERTIYITRELYWHGMESLDIVPMLKQKIPELVKYNRRVIADSHDPATISQLSRTQIHRSGERIEALNIIGAVKGPGSVEEGINWLKSFKIVVDPSCKNTIFELHNYKYQVDKNNGEIIPKIEDKHNHAIDALRYAYNDEIVSERGGQVKSHRLLRPTKRKINPIWAT